MLCVISSVCNRHYSLFKILKISIDLRGSNEYGFIYTFIEKRNE